jgi:dipeptidyl aminopeptidase/acylaminoacyl peptidase
VLNLIHLFREAGIDYEAHIYARGGHGFGVGAKATRQSLRAWSDRMLEWLQDEVVDEPPKRR